MKSCKEFRNAGLNDLTGKWLKAVGVSFVAMLLVCIVYFVPTMLFFRDNAIIPNVYSIILSILALPMMWSLSIIFIRNHRSDGIDYFNPQNLFLGYKDSRVFSTLLLMILYTYLWGLLLIVPGIIKSLSYSLTPYILYDHPEMKNNQAIELSMKMMQGRKMKLFLLYLSFFGWGILCVLTLCIGVIWLAPYMQASFVNFYDETKTEYDSQNVETY